MLSDQCCTCRPPSPDFVSEIHAMTPIPRARLRWPSKDSKIIGNRLFVDHSRVRLDGGRQAFRHLWGNDMYPPPLVEEDEDSDLSETTSLRDEILLRFSPLGKPFPQLLSNRDGCNLSIGWRESSYEKACSDRRGSAPSTPVLGSRNMDTPTQSRFANFFSKKPFKHNPLKRTKSVTKLERKRCTIYGDSIPPSRLRTSRSHESLLQSSPNVLATLNLSRGDVQVMPLHGSILGHDHCFQLISSGRARYYSCRTSEERNKWVNSLRHSIHPQQDTVKRKENSLKIWILEAKGMVSKKRYFCELCLDKTLYARTTSRHKADICFWGEHFEFNNLPQIGSITVNLYREADKKKRRDKNVLLGTIQIPVSSVNSKHMVEKWYHVIAEKNVGNKDVPSVRVKARFQTIDILPLSAYKEFLQYLKQEYRSICEMLEPAISVRVKEEIATTLVHIMQKENMAKNFLADVVMDDIGKIDDQHLTFRGNSLATKATEAYMKLLGEKYLQDTLQEFVHIVLESSDDCEVDPSKVSNNAVLQQHQSNLLTYVEMVWIKIVTSVQYMPYHLREVFSVYRERLAAVGKEDVSDNLISASVFLRFLCPAILSPSLFSLTQEYPQDKAARNLTLITKTIQTLANFTKFGGKESFMEFMNEFVEKEWSTMKHFLWQISSPLTKDCQPSVEFDGYICLGRELSILHSLLKDSISKINRKLYYEQVETLEQVLNGISAAASQPSYFRQMSAPPLNYATQNQVHIISQEGEKSNNQTLHFTRINSKNGEDLSRHINGTVLTTSQQLGKRETSSPDSLCRSSTLPRNTILTGTITKSAKDILTADGHNLVSAGQIQLSSMLEKTASRNIGIHSNRLNSVLPCMITQSVYNESPETEMMQVSSIGVQSVKSTSIKQDPTWMLDVRKDTGRSKVAKEKRHDNMILLHPDDDPSNASSELDNQNIQGSQFSTVTSSGYQSITYSHSSSSNDPIHQDNLTRQHVALPLAFKNPMYHFSESDGLPHKTTRHNQPIKILDSVSNRLSNSQSDEDLFIVGSPCAGSSSLRDCSIPLSTSPRTIPQYLDSQQVDFSRSALRHCHTCPREAKSRRAKLTHGVSVDITSTSEGNVKNLYKRNSQEPPSEPQQVLSIKQLHSGEKQPHRRNSKIKKTVEEYEQEIETLKGLMTELHSKLNQTEKKLSQQENNAEQFMAECQAKLEAGEVRLKKQQEEKDQQMKSIITRLITVEEELRREQQEMQGIIVVKEKVIEEQERKIHSLDTANIRLMTNLSQLKDRYKHDIQNGIPKSPLKMTLIDNVELPFKSSSC
ncbi:ras GTPase-activating protein nGAP-like isoform X4 [Tachypleus tridentatus]